LLLFIFIYLKYTNSRTTQSFSPDHQENSQTFTWLSSCTRS